MTNPENIENVSPDVILLEPEGRPVSHQTRSPVSSSKIIDPVLRVYICVLLSRNVTATLTEFFMI
jgi:hypothetical protein